MKIEYYEGNGLVVYTTLDKYYLPEHLIYFTLEGEATEGQDGFDTILSELDECDDLDMRGEVYKVARIEGVFARVNDLNNRSVWVYGESRAEALEALDAEYGIYDDYL